MICTLKSFVVGRMPVSVLLNKVSLIEGAGGGGGGGLGPPSKKSSIEGKLGGLPPGPNKLLLPPKLLFPPLLLLLVLLLLFLPKLLLPKFI